MPCRVRHDGCGAFASFPDAPHSSHTHLLRHSCEDLHSSSARAPIVIPAKTTNRHPREDHHSSSARAPIVIPAKAGIQGRCLSFFLDAGSGSGMTEGGGMPCRVRHDVEGDARRNRTHHQSSSPTFVIGNPESLPFLFSGCRIKSGMTVGGGCHVESGMTLRGMPVATAHTTNRHPRRL